MKILTSLFILPFFLQSAYSADSPLQWSGNIYKKIYQYKELHSKFSRQVCSGGADAKYYDLLRKYRGAGFYLPLIDDDIDRDAIKAHLHHFKAKLDFIRKTKKKLEKQETLPHFKVISNDISETITRLLNYKKEYAQELRLEKLKKIKADSNKDLDLLRKQFDTFMDHIFFLKSYHFPNDHLKNRRTYEDYKDSDKKSDQKKANRTFFFRRIVEDGAYDPDHSRPDLYLRSTLDTLYLAIRKEKDFISENLRYDLDWSLKNIEAVLSRGYKVQLSRLEEWEARTEETYKFYLDIIKTKNKKKAHQMVEEKNKATHLLKNYVYAKQAETYKWWMKQPELMRALYAMETILFNEVGTVDGEDALERYDVAQIVLNRVTDSFYSSLSSKQILVDFLDLKEDVYSKYRWLNTLFRVGEFSFTYHYIPSVVKIFCPGMSKFGRILRDKNVKISLQALKNYRGEFKALRYFSRVSMLGKIDMSSVWYDYEKFPERPGLEIGNQRQLTRYYLADKFQYLYSFVDSKGISFQVIKIGDETYSMRWEKGKPKFFKYRDPHLFKYFLKK